MEPPKYKPVDKKLSGKTGHGTVSSAKPVVKVVSPKTHCCSVCKEPLAASRQPPKLFHHGVKKISNFEITLLFNRLDTNNDLKLSRDEFKNGLNDKQKLKIDTKILDKLFDKHNGNGDKFLQIREFTAAYMELMDMISSGESVLGTMTDSFDQGKRNFVMKATRYGYINRSRSTANENEVSDASTEEEAMVCDCYVVYLNQEPCKQCKKIPSELRIIAKKYHIANNATNKNHWSEVLKNSVEQTWNLEKGKTWNKTLMEMIEDDSKNNKNICWWVDVACGDINSLKEEVVNWFQLPMKEPKLMSAFSSFGTALSDDIDDRIFARNNNNNNSDIDATNSSLNMFIQIMHTRKTPVFKLPYFDMFDFDWGYRIMSRIINSVSDYFCKRFPPILEFYCDSSKNKMSNDRNKRLNVNAYASALVFERIFELDEVVTKLYRDAKKDRKNESTIEAKGESACMSGAESWKDFRRCEPAPFYDYHIDSKAVNVMTSSADYIMENKPSFHCDTLGLHLLDFGYGCNCLLTIRQIDDEIVLHGPQDKDNEIRAATVMQNSKMLEPLSRMGVYGRIFYALWLKIVELAVSERGESAILGELDESPMSLAGTIICIVHDFSRQSTIAPINFWLDTLESEVNDIIVSKHFAHCASLEKSLNELNLYLSPWSDFWDKILAESKGAEAKKAKQQKQIWSVEEGILDNDGGFEGTRPQQSSSFETRERRASLINVIRTLSGENDNISMKVDDGVMDSSAVDDVVVVEQKKDLLPENVNKTDLNYHDVIRFFGKNSYDQITKIIDGNPKHELRGISAWSANINALIGRTKDLRETMRSLREEKRQFTTFLLTITSVLLAPMTIITGYWGMNFENMYELTPETYPLAPGVHIMWLFVAIIYGMFFLCAIHFRVIYSAS